MIDNEHFRWCVVQYVLAINVQQSLWVNITEKLIACGFFFVWPKEQTNDSNITIVVLMCIAATSAVLFTPCASIHFPNGWAYCEPHRNNWQMHMNGARGKTMNKCTIFVFSCIVGCTNSEREKQNDAKIKKKKAIYTNAFHWTVDIIG